MCPICISTAALAALAGSGSAGGVAAFVAVKLHLKREPKRECDARSRGTGSVPRSTESGGDK